MPPRYAYWTILIGSEPTSFRAREREELMPTLKRLQARHGDARMVWFQNGKVWDSRLDAQEAMRARGERGREGDFRQRQQQQRAPGAASSPQTSRPSSPHAPASSRPRPKLEWKPKGAVGTPSRPPSRKPSSPQRRDRNWRPGGEHRDPRQRYKDARKAKWTRYKQTIRKRWEAKQGPKKKDEE